MDRLNNLFLQYRIDYYLRRTIKQYGIYKPYEIVVFNTELDLMEWWDAWSGECIKTISLDFLKSYEPKYYEWIHSPDGKFIGAIQNPCNSIDNYGAIISSLAVFDVETEKILFTIPKCNLHTIPEYNKCYFAFTEYGQLLARNGHTIWLWSLPSGSCIDVVIYPKMDNIKDCKDSIFIGKNSRENRFLGAFVTEGSSLVFVYNVFTKQRKCLKGHSSPVNYAHLSIDGKFCVSGNRYENRVWNVDTGKCLWAHTLTQGSDVQKLHFSPNGKYLMAVTPRLSRGIFWNAKTGKVCGRIPQRFFPLDSDFSFSCDDKMIVINSSYDDRARVFKVPSGEFVSILNIVFSSWIYRGSSLRFKKNTYIK